MAVQFSENVHEVEYETYDDGLRADEANQFETLCDGVINSLALLHTSTREVLEFKDDLMAHYLPSNVLLKLSLLSGKLYRSTSDLNFPLNELIRLVRVYSSSWEEKSEALKKLHDDYEKKAKQLNIALHKLSVQDTEANRVQNAKRLLNWERLFCKVQLAKGHGRRWKFKMHDFRTRYNKGREHLAPYFKAGAVPDGDEDIRGRGMGQADGSPRSRRVTVAIKEEAKESEDEDDLDDLESDVEVDQEVIDEPVVREVIRVIKAPTPEPIETSDACVSTVDKEYQDTLHLRLYNPGLQDQTGVKASVHYGTLTLTVASLDAPEDTQPAEPAKPDKPRKGLIGARTKSAEQKTTSIKFREVVVPIPDEVRRGVTNDPEMRTIKVNLLADNDVTLASVTIDMDDLKNLDLPVKDAEAAGVSNRPSSGESPFPSLEPTNFPLYGAETRDQSMGNMPIGLFWERKLVTNSENAETETRPLYEIIYEMTGIDLNVVTVDDLISSREMTDVCISPRPQTPLPETVLKEEFDEMVLQKQNEMDFLQQQYTIRVQDLETALSNSVPRPPTPPPVESRGNSPHKAVRPTPPPGHSATMQTGPSVAPSPQRYTSTSPHPRPKSVISGPEKLSKDKLPSRASTAVADEKDGDQFIPESGGGPAPTPAQLGQPLASSRSQMSSHRTKWGANWPEDPFSRMEMLSTSAQNHREQLVKKTKAEVARDIEISLAGMYKLDTHQPVPVPSDTQEAWPDGGGFEAALRDVTLPALFMPQRNSGGTLYNPRAHQYFHPVGVKNVRLSQAPSMVALPPIRNQVSVLSLFDMGNQIRSRGYPFSSLSHHHHHHGPQSVPEGIINSSGAAHGFPGDNRPEGSGHPEAFTEDQIHEEPTLASDSVGQIVPDGTPYSPRTVTLVTHPTIVE